ncbi:MAG: L,D-transpeptidase [Gammaproteobacteria bacterium]|nr:L,D-transpeptidase [Gammaproteobacteria bacterium]
MRTLPAACRAACARRAIAPTEQVVVISAALQTASVYEDGVLARTLRCSTSRFGVGQVEGSYRTPLGLHRVAEKIGDGEPAGTVFKGRRVVGHTAEAAFADATITTRILWLEGLEPGVNQGGTVDSHARFIYIHGTSDQAVIGRPASHGCILLADADLLWLFDRLPLQSLVWIQPE